MNLREIIEAGNTKAHGQQALEWRVAAYARGYNVPDKIRAAKLDGSFFGLLL